MSQTVPLIRAAAMIPFVRWMKQNNRPLDPSLRAVDLETLPFMKPDHPIALINALRFIEALSDAEGPDIGCRVVSSSTLIELALIGKIALGTRTPREALERVASSLPYHCSHELITVWRKGKVSTVRSLMSVKVSQTARHIQQQYSASILSVLCELSGAPQPVFKQIALAPHPVHGLDHLRPCLDSKIVASNTRALTIEVDNSVLDRPFPTCARDRSGGALPPGVETLQYGGKLGDSARPILEDMLEFGRPSVEGLAVAAGVSTRTLQRRLSQEGLTFTSLLDDVREQIALKKLASGGASIGAIAATLGYTGQGALTRAMHRWRGAAPKDIRKDLQA